MSPRHRRILAVTTVTAMTMKPRHPSCTHALVIAAGAALLGGCSADRDRGVTVPATAAATSRTQSSGRTDVTQPPGATSGGAGPQQERFSLAGVVVVGGRTDAGWALISANGEQWEALRVGSQTGQGWTVHAVGQEAVILRSADGAQRVLRIHAQVSTGAGKPTPNSIPQQPLRHPGRPHRLPLNLPIEK
jgi:hypothetical protein